MRDGDHDSTCQHRGRTRVHTAVLRTLEDMVRAEGGTGTHWEVTEPRGDHFYNYKNLHSGPDAIIRTKRGAVVIDVTGVTAETWTAAFSFGVNGSLGMANTNLQSNEARSTRPNSQLTPLEQRQKKKMNSDDAKHVAKQTRARYVAGCYTTNGGLAAEFNALLPELFGRHSTPFKHRDKSITSRLEWTRRRLRATILNAHAAAIRANMQHAYKIMEQDEEVAWWRDENSAACTERGVMEDIEEMREEYITSETDDDSDIDNDGSGASDATMPAAVRSTEDGWVQVTGGQRSQRASASGGGSARTLQHRGPHTHDRRYDTVAPEGDAPLPFPARGREPLQPTPAAAWTTVSGRDAALHRSTIRSSSGQAARTATAATGRLSGMQAGRGRSHTGYRGKPNGKGKARASEGARHTMTDGGKRATLARVVGESAEISAARPRPRHTSASRREAGRADGTGGGGCSRPGRRGGAQAIGIVIGPILEISLNRH